MSSFSSKKKPSVAGKKTAKAQQSSLPSPDQAETASASSGSQKAEGDTRPDLSPEDARKHAAAAKQLAAAFGEIVTLLMRSEADRKRSIAELEWLVTPAIVTGQFVIADAQSKKTGATYPVGTVLWAMVSEEVDERLSDTKNENPKLTPQEWRSGPIPWIVMAIGDKRVVAGLIKKITKDVFKDQEPKIRSHNAEGQIIVGRVRLAESGQTGAEETA